ncbi:hypothetical protein O3P69_005792 [Scylla paramamosain]
MASLQQVNEALGQVVTFLAPLVPLIGCHMVDFLTLRHWDNLLSPQIQHDLLSLPASVLHQLPSATLPHAWNHAEAGSSEPWNVSSSDLPTFLSQVRRHCPAALGVTTPIEQILDQYGSAEISVLPMKGIMSHKKTHEVEVMAQVIARLAKGQGVNWLVDLGSGRGYLTSSLVLQYGRQVVAIDSSSSNTSSALVRNTKLKRLWDNMMQTRQHRAEGRPVKKGKTRRKKVVAQQQQQQQQREEEQERKLEDTRDQDAGRYEESPPVNHSGCFFGVTKFITDDTDLLELVRGAVGSEKVERNGIDSVLEKIMSGTRRQVEGIEDASDALPHPQNTLEGQTCTTTPAPVEDPSLADTNFLVDETSLLGLVGLHTCGNLASSSLRLFVANPRVHFLCNVGCCYHLLEEEFSKNTYNQRKTQDEDRASASSPLRKEICELKHTEEEHHLRKQEHNAPQSSTNHDERDVHSTGLSHTTKESAVPPTTEREGCSPPKQSSRVEKQQDPPVPETISRGGQDEGDIDPLHPSRIPNLGHGFPLSSFLRERRFSLGRNSRMLSSQATDRLTQGNISGPDSLYWRALLQMVLVDKLGDISELSHVGRLSGKCQTFTEYARVAIARLGVSINVTEEELEEYDRKHSNTKDKLERFFLLRASVAAVVEGAMLLDRLAFLCEQEDVSAYLVPLFDPITSPRCHALLAVRATAPQSGPEE